MHPTGPATDPCHFQPAAKVAYSKMSIITIDPHLWVTEFQPQDQSLA